MILPDINVLVYAFHRDSPRHEAYAAWLAGALGGGEELALTDVVLTGFVRVVTNSRAFADPAPAPDALSFVTILRAAPAARVLVPTDASWVRFGQIIATDRQVRGNLVPDAWLAALAVTHGCRLATADRGFARFEQLDWFIPVP